MDGFSPREVTSDDLNQISELELKLQKAPWSRDQFIAEIENPKSIFIIVSDDKTDSQVAGFIIFWKVLDQAQILNLLVDLDHRGQGFGIQLIQYAVRYTLRHECREISLEVRKSNAPAIQLYQRCNFSIAGVRKEFYSDSEDAYTMVLDLTNQENLKF